MQNEGIINNKIYLGLSVFPTSVLWEEKNVFPTLAKLTFLNILSGAFSACLTIRISVEP
jgi:hypothetical protein